MQSKLVSGAKFGRYEVLRRLASGGMAQLCLARQTGSAGFEKRVALKVLHPHLAECESVVKMFVHEASIAAQLTHPNVVHVLDLGTEGDQYFIAMEYIPGTNVRQFMHRATKAGLRRLPLWALIQIAVATCDGLQYIHDFANESGEQLGLVHRDISPENIMVSFYGAVKLVDFGVLRIQGVHRTGMGEIVGKPHYMAPEQIRDQRIDRRADLFSLGVVLYEGLCGRRPFQGDGAAAVLMAILEDEPTPVRALEPSVPADLERIVMKLLARRADDRYQDAATVREDLVAFARTQRIARDQRHLALLTASLFEDDVDVPGPVRRLLQATACPGAPRSDVHVIAAATDEVRTEATPPIGAIPSDVLQPRPRSGPDAGTVVLETDEEVDDDGWDGVVENSLGAEVAGPASAPLSPPAPAAKASPETRTATDVFSTPAPRRAAESTLASAFTAARTGGEKGTGDIWTVRRHVASGGGAPVVGEARAPDPRHTLLFEEGLEHVAKGAYALALSAWEEACRLAPANRSYAANLKKLKARLASNPR